MIDLIIFWIGVGLLFLGGVLDVIAAVGMNRFNNFFLRLHAATVGSIGGAVYPLAGIALIAISLDMPATFKYYIAGISVIAGLLIVLTAPAGSHILAKAAHKSGEVSPKPVIVDKLREKEEVSEE